MRMNRLQAVQSSLDRSGGGTYLEIGVAWGWALCRVRATRKIGVDPKFRMGPFASRGAHRGTRELHLMEMTSDDFFAGHAHLLHGGLDAALVDGQHTYEQSLKDVEHCLNYLNDDGTIVMHDCNPATESQGLPVESFREFRERYPMRIFWCGDVWKTIVHLRSTRDDLRVAVLDCDFGVGLIRKGIPDSRLAYSMEQIVEMTFADLDAHRAELLNLRPPEELIEFLAPRGAPAVGR